MDGLAMLNSRLTCAETKRALQSLARGKRVGCDGVSNDVLTAAAESPAFVRLTNRHHNEFFDTGVKPEAWEVEEQAAAHKKGDIEQPNNKRARLLFTYT